MRTPGHLLNSRVLSFHHAGSITTVMVSADERSNEFRTRVESLKEFADTKEIPEVRGLPFGSCNAVPMHRRGLSSRRIYQAID